ncbi:hypothetical protein ACOSQ2_014080 [Xanthoceras sorbifolium]
MDSGATNHVTSNPGNLSIRSDYNENERLTVGNGQQLPITQIGTSHLVSHTQPATILQLKDVLHVPNITKNFLNISKFTKDNNACAEFYNNHFVIKDKVSRKMLLHGQLRSGLNLHPLSRSMKPQLVLCLFIYLNHSLMVVINLSILVLV